MQYFCLDLLSLNKNTGQLKAVTDIWRYVNDRWKCMLKNPNQKYGVHVNLVFLDIVNQFSLSQCQLEPTGGFNILDFYHKY